MTTAASFIADLAALADPMRRLDAARALARTLAADDLVFFVRDTDAFLPAVGFPETFPDGTAWQALVREAAAEASTLTRELTCPFTAQPKHCLALATDPVGDVVGVAVLIGAREESARLDELRAAMPLLIGLFRAERSLAAGAQRIAHADELFAGVLGHDLRNPLGSILMGAELLVRIDPDPRIQKTVERIIRSGHRMRRMIDQLLDFTRVRTGGALPLEKRTTSLTELCEQIVGELQASHPEWTLRTDPVGDVVGLWDGDRLAQVLSNLVGNAIQHGLPSGGVHIRIDGTAPEVVVVDVHNEGAIPPEVLPTIFDPFRTTRGLRDRSQGLGLGLFITREIVVAHGGEVEVTSTPATGTTFRLRLPRRAEGAAAR